MSDYSFGALRQARSGRAENSSSDAAALGCALVALILLLVIPVGVVLQGWMVHVLW